MNTSRQQYEGWFTDNIYALAKTYAYKNPIDGMETEDYIQELVAMAWDRLDRYDPSKSTLTTFAFMWFRNVRYRLIDKLMNRSKFMTWADVEDSDGNVFNVCDNAVASDDVASEQSITDALTLASPIASLLFGGDSLVMAAKTCGVSVSEASDMLRSDMEIIKKAFGMEG